MKQQYTFLKLFPFLPFLLAAFLWFGGSSVLAAGTGAATGVDCSSALPVPTNCSGGYNVPASHGYSGVSPQCMGVDDPLSDGWWVWTPASDGVWDIDIGGGGGGKDVGIAIYSGTCGSLETEACSNANDAGDSPETIFPFLATGGETYYIQIFKVGGSGDLNNTDSGTGFCMTEYTSVNVVSCSGTSTDPGGAGGSGPSFSQPAGNYPNSSLYVYTYCSDSPTDTIVSLNFSAFQLENGAFDFVTVYDGDGVEGNQILGEFTSTNSPGTVTSSTGCLTLVFQSDNIITSTGWEAAISCTDQPATLPEATIADCLGAIGLCGTSTTNVSGFGSGNYEDLSLNNDGCLFGENNTVWYFLKIDDADGDGDPMTSGTGTLGFTLTMPNQVDYDYAVWGPLEGNNPEDFCSPSGAPSRCSYSIASGNSNTTMGLSETEDPDQVSENGGASEDAWVYWYDDIQDGQVYLIMIDRFGTSDVHDYEISFTGTASNSGGLDCSVLPVELNTINGFHVDGRYNIVQWSTSSEYNSSHFIVERKDENDDWTVIGSLPAAGESTQKRYYNFNDYGYKSSMSYYRIQMVDVDGSKEYSDILVINSLITPDFVGDLFPNPSDGNVNVSLNLSKITSELDVQVLDVTGKVIETLNFNKSSLGNTIQLELGSLASGIYNVRFRSGDKVEIKSLRKH